MESVEDGIPKQRKEKNRINGIVNIIIRNKQKYVIII